jgi:hypothetical protein
VLGDRIPLSWSIAAVTGPVVIATPFRIPEVVQPVRIHLVDTTTGAEKTWDVAPDSFAAVGAPAQFSPDGRRILFRYDRRAEREPNAPAPQGRTPLSDRLWVARLDGTVEREIVLPSVPRDRRTEGFGGTPFGSNVACSPDGRHVAVSGPEIVQIWDLDTGTLRHTLAGHSGYQRDGIMSIYNADGSRLFTLEGGTNRATSQFTTRAQIHVWETAGGRELLTIDQGDAVRPFIRPAFADGKLVLQMQVNINGGGGERVLDGTPEKP